MTEQSASLPGRREFSSADLRRVRSRALRAASRAREACDRLGDHLAGLARVLLQELAQPGVDDRLHEALHAGVAQLGLGLALELRIAQLGRDDRGQALAHVLAGEVVLLLLEQALLARVAVERARQGGAKARQVRAALVGVDVVGERVDRLLVGGVPLHRHLDGALLALTVEEHDLLLHRVLVLVEVRDEVADPALVAELGLLALGALVDQRDAQAAGEEGRLLQALLDRVELVVQRLEDVGVGQEGDGGARLLGGRALLQRGARGAPVVVLSPAGSVATDVHVQRLRQRVDHRHADAVQAAGHLVATAVAELAPGVQHGQHHLHRRALLLVVHGHRDAAAVVGDGDRVVGVDHHRHRIAVAGQRLVDRVVDHLVDQVMQSPRAGGADVHAGPLAHRLQTFEHGDVAGVVAGGRSLLAACSAGLLVARHQPPAHMRNPDAAPIGLAGRGVVTALQNNSTARPPLPCPGMRRFTCKSA